MSKKDVLEECVRASLERYFEDLGESEPHDMWDMVMRCVERPVLEVALERSGGNQSRASEMLGITRNKDETAARVQEALRRVRRIEPQFVQSEEQEDFLQRYEDHLLARLT